MGKPYSQDPREHVMAAAVALPGVDARPARSMTAAVLAALLDALEHLWVGRSLHIEKSGRALLQPAKL